MHSEVNSTDTNLWLMEKACAGSALLGCLALQKANWAIDIQTTNQNLASLSISEAAWPNDFKW